ncbi:MAG: class I SAM-dependent methyltransferase [Actinomycetota bacterium]
MPQATDYERIAPVYDRGRAIPLEALDGWRVALSDYLPPAGGGAVLDLGSGTGIFSVALATWFDCWVVGMEPSEAMRSRAMGARSHDRVVYIGGLGQRIPLAASSCGCAWLSTVVHHITDLRACARELRRVIAPGGRVLVRNAFADRTTGVTWLRYFPEGAKLARRRWPTVQMVVERFSAAGFEQERLTSVEQVTAPDMRAYIAMIQTRADSSLAMISDGDFARGLKALERAAAEPSSSAPIVDRLDLLVLR